MIYSYSRLINSTTYRTFDQEGRPYPIADDDLGEILSKSDFAKDEVDPDSPLLNRLTSDSVCRCWGEQYE